MAIHELKAWPSEFEASKRGDKPYEFRKDDRGFTVGDTLVLLKWDPARECVVLGELTFGHYIGEDGMTVTALTADTLRGTVTHILSGGRFGVPDDYCVMGVRWETA